MLNAICPVLIDWPVSFNFSLLGYSIARYHLSCSRCLINLSSLYYISVIIIKGITVYNSSFMLSQCLACSCCQANLSSLCSGVSRAPAFTRCPLACYQCLARQFSQSLCLTKCVEETKYAGAINVYTYNSNGHQSFMRMVVTEKS